MISDPGNRGRSIPAVRNSAHLTNSQRGESRPVNANGQPESNSPHDSDNGNSDNENNPDLNASFTRRSSLGSASNRREGGIMERLFGDVVTSEARRSYLPARHPQALTSGASNAQPEAIHTRTLLTASVYHNQATNLWITTINTNQKDNGTNSTNAARYLQAFSFHTEREARESAYANAPPRMIPFNESPSCFICKGKFAVFRRPCHCRNCGVCICGSCSTTWSSRMIPETYNIKNESNVKVCKSCNFLAGAFRLALLEGQYDEAVALYNTGNVNLRCPFTNIKGTETMFPIHCAVEGGNLPLLRWLVDVHFCPIKLIRTGNRNRDRGSDIPIRTSKGRSVLSISMASKNVDILRYLAIEKSVSVFEIKELNTSLGALEAVLNAFPDRSSSNNNNNNGDALGAISPGGINTEHLRSIDLSSAVVIRNHQPFDLTRDGSLYPEINVFEDSDSGGGGDENDPAKDEKKEEEEEDDDDESVATTVADACILCYEKSIDCVNTPCGHQICCLECSNNLDSCPVCNSECQFIRIYKP